MRKLVLYVHGQGGSADETTHYREKNACLNDRRSSL